MTYPTLMIHLQLGAENAGLFHVADALADRFGSDIIGIVACQPMQLIYNDTCYVPEAVFDQNRRDIDDEIGRIEAEFRRVLQTRSRVLGWRAIVSGGSLPDRIASEARCADLVVTAASSATVSDPSWRVNAGDLVMQVGRPVLAVPPGTGTIGFAHVVLGWKDTRESRRAAHDALPLLKMAGKVSVVELASTARMDDARRRVGDVAAWLKRHGVEAQALAVAAAGDEVTALGDWARQQDADIVVAGGYGHGRLHEWALGGVTRDLLFRSERCVLLSH